MLWQIISAVILLAAHKGCSCTAGTSLLGKAAQLSLHSTFFLQVVEGKLSAGELSSFVIYALYVGSNVGSLASVISNLIQVSSLMRRPYPSRQLTCRPLIWTLTAFVSLLVSRSDLANDGPVCDRHLLDFQHFHNNFVTAGQLHVWSELDPLRDVCRLWARAGGYLSCWTESPSSPQLETHSPRAPRAAVKSSLKTSGRARKALWHASNCHNQYIKYEGK